MGNNISAGMAIMQGYERISANTAMMKQAAKARHDAVTGLLDQAIQAGKITAARGNNLNVSA